MENKKNISEEIMQNADTYRDHVAEDMLEIYEDDEFPDTSDAGRYCWTRSSEDPKAMMRGKRADFNSKVGRWFESMGCGYACWRDGKYFQEEDIMSIDDFHDSHPNITCRESCYDLEYGDTEDDVRYAWFYLEEYEGKKHRTFDISMLDIPMSTAEEYIAAIEEWHRTGEFNIDQYHGCPNFSPWRQW